MDGNGKEMVLWETLSKALWENRNEAGTHATKTNFDAHGIF